MSGTALAYGATLEMSGTELAYAASVLAYASTVRCPRTCLRVHYAVSGTELAKAERCPVLP
eukprot:121284-Rhodomonas_salina.1